MTWYGANTRANGIRQHYIRYPQDAAPLLIVPGISTVAMQWAFIAERLQSAFDVYVLDVRGRGLSEAGAHLDYSMNAYAADVVALINELKRERLTLVGHSMGARIGARVARAVPESIDKLVMVDPPMSGPGRRHYPIPLAPLMDLIARAKLGQVEEHLRKGRGATWPDKHIRMRAEWLHTCDERAIEETYRSFHEDDFHGDVAGLRVQTSLLVAGRDGVILPEDEREMRRILPFILIERVGSAGHQMQVEQPEAFLRALLSLINSNTQHPA
jgi:N-formylmaleamate deformylase